MSICIYLSFEYVLSLPEREGLRENTRAAACNLIQEGLRDTNLDPCSCPNHFKKGRATIAIKKKPGGCGHACTCNSARTKPIIIGLVPSSLIPGDLSPKFFGALAKNSAFTPAVFRARRTCCFISHASTLSQTEMRSDQSDQSCIDHIEETSKQKTADRPKTKDWQR